MLRVEEEGKKGRSPSQLILEIRKQWSRGEVSPMSKRMSKLY